MTSPPTIRVDVPQDVVHATELVAAGVDVRTAAGRLGHGGGGGGGGTTILQVCAAWVADADQRAASATASRLPKRPS
jgi:integrase